MLPARVLVVDDDPEVLASVSRYLTAVGFDCVGACDAASALSECVGRRPDVMLLDLALGRVSGFLLFRALRADARTKAIPVVLMTGQPNHDLLKDAGLCSGAAAFLRKPLELPGLTSVLRGVLAPDGAGVDRRAAGLVRGPGFQVDPANGRLFAAGRIEHLEPKEKELLLLLLRHRGRILSRQFIGEQVWRSSRLPQNTLETRISSIRQKLGRLETCLENVRGQGYRLLP